MADEPLFQYPAYHIYDGISYNVTFPKENLDRIKNEMNYDPKDIILIGYPKTGTTWMQEILYLVCNGGDINDRLAKSLDDCFPQLELAVPDGVNNVDLAQATAPPRFMKSHLQDSFFTRELSKNENSAKFIVLIREPKDTLVSWYYFHKMIPEIIQFKGKFDHFFESLVRRRKLWYGDPVDYMVSWHKYINHPNVMFVKYEDVKEDAEVWIRKLAAFLGKPMDDKMVHRILDFTSFDAMKARGIPHDSWAHFADENVAPFIRKGIVGDHKNHFSAEQSSYIDAMCKEKLSGTTIKYGFE